MAEPVPGNAGTSERRNRFDFRQALTWIIALACGGLGGSVFTNWYNNRSTVIQYSVTKTVLGTDQTTVVPDFRLQVAGTVLQRLYLYAVKIQYRSGPELENAKVGVEITPSANLIGNTVPESPGEVYAFQCAPFSAKVKSKGTTCVLSRLNSHIGAYSLSFATDTEVNIGMSIDARNSEINLADLASPRDSRDPAVVMALVMIVVLLVFLGWLLNDLSRISTGIRNKLDR